MKKILFFALLVFVFSIPSVPGCGKSAPPKNNQADEEALERKRKLDFEELTRKAGRAYENKLEISKQRRTNGDLQGAIDALKELPAEFNETIYAEAAKQEIKKLENAIAGQKEFDDTFKEKLDAMKETGNYKEAARMLNEFDIKYGGTVYPGYIERERNELRRLIEEQRNESK